MAEVAEVYCGPPPTPASLASAWNPDLLALALFIVLAGVLTARGARIWPASLGLGLFVLLFVSPLCALTVALFSARAVHHVLLVAAVAPLLAMALPADPSRRPVLSLGWLVGLHAAAFWFWHLPEVYDLAIRSTAGYWSMQLSLLGTGVLLWRRILAPGPAGPALLALFATISQMGLLGALLTFLRVPVYASHLATTEAFGLTPVEDQQLAGLVMWVPAALPYLAAALIIVAGRLESAATAERRPG